MATYLSLTNEILREMNEVALTSSTFANAIGEGDFINPEGSVSISLTDITLNVTALNSAIDIANSFNGEVTSSVSVFSLDDGATINGGDESAFRALLTNEENGQVLITDQNLIVDSGEISIETANDLDATTEGIVTADIDINATVDSLSLIHI